MTSPDVSAVQNWHAHVYFDAAQRDAAWALREQIEARFEGKLQLGRFDVFLHPNTGDGLTDHRDAAVWIGHSHTLKLEVFGK